MTYDNTSHIFTKSVRLVPMDTKEEIQQKFGKALLRIIEEKALSIRKLSIAAGLEYAHVQRITAGKVNLELTTIMALCRGLDIGSDQLFVIYEDT